MPYLDATDVRSRDRVFTQALARAICEEGATGVVYPSNLDDARCIAIFEGRGEAIVTEPARRLSEDIDLVATICAQLGLRLAE